MPIPLPQRVFLFWIYPAHPSGNSSFNSCFSLKMLAFDPPVPLEISNNPPWRGYGNFLVRIKHIPVPLILDKAGQSFSSWNGVFSILICCCRNLWSLCSPSSPVLHTVTWKESLWSDKYKLPSDSEWKEDKDPVGITCFFLLIAAWSLSFDVFVSFLFVEWSWPLVAK